MSKITLDAQLRQRLNGLGEALEICDEAGQTVGHFIPEQIYQRLLYRLAESQCPYSSEQLTEMRKQTGGKSLDQIWRELGQNEVHGHLAARCGENAC